MAHTIASRHSYQSLVTGALTLTVASGAPVRVYGMLLTPAAADTTFTIKDADGNTLQVIFLNAGDTGGQNTLELTTQWLADGGVSVTSSVTGAHATVFHNNPGS